MSIHTCPTAMFHAPGERVWRLLTTLDEWQRWSRERIVKGPDRPLAAGDQFELGVGFGHLVRIHFAVLDLEPLRRLTLDIHMPLGIVNREVVIITPQSDTACWVTFT